MYKKITEFLTNLFRKDISLKIISIVLAIGVWAAVSITEYPIIETTFYNIPMTISMEGTYAQANQLDTVNPPSQTVTLTISGERGKIGSLKAEDFTAWLDMSTVMLPREYNLPVRVTCTADSEFDVKSIEPSSLRVSFDKIVSKEFEVSPLLENASIAAGYMSGDPIVTPSTVTVTGPQNTINTITDARVKVSPNRVLDSTYDFTSDQIVLYNGNSVLADTSSLSFDKTSFSVQIPVFVRKTLPLDVDIINAPENFDLDYFREQLTYSVNELTIAAPNDKINERESLSIGTINMREVDKGSRFEFRTENFLPEGYENLSQTDVITVTCPSEGIAAKPIVIMGKDIQFVNRPPQFEFTPVVSGLTISLVGDEEQIAEISSADITAQIDLFDFDMEEGDKNLPVDIIIFSYDKVWFSGKDGVATPKIYVTARYIEIEE
ncbi:MAG: CdaR family protein [Ruminococcus sp.]|nr:CdaR family protein [Ruminococcus sp.]